MVFHDAVKKLKGSDQCVIGHRISVTLFKRFPGRDSSRELTCKCVKVDESICVASM
jgi:hypothetical protein